MTRRQPRNAKRECVHKIKKEKLEANARAASHVNLAGLKGRRSTEVASPSSMSSATPSPMAGPIRMPQQPPPVATKAPGVPGTAPSIGSPSGAKGRWQADSSSTGAWASYRGEGSGRAREGSGDRAKARPGPARSTPRPSSTRDAVSPRPAPPPRPAPRTPGPSGRGSQSRRHSRPGEGTPRGRLVPGKRRPVGNQVRSA